MLTVNQQLQTAVQAVVIHSHAGYSWFGRPAARLPSAMARAFGPPGIRDYLVFSLQGQLYQDFYQTGGAAPYRRVLADVDRARRDSFAAELSTVNAGHGYLTAGWEVRSLSETHAVVRCSDLELVAPLANCVFREGRPLQAGDSVSVRFPKEALGMSPGFYVAEGDETFGAGDSRALVRIYLNVTPDGAVLVVRQLTTSLNGAGLPFKLKALSDPARFGRCDSAVLYLRKRDFPAAAELLAALHAQLGVELRDGTPALTKRLASGIGLAEDPGIGDSFGMHRCRLVAEGLLHAYEMKQRSEPARIRAIEARFADAGIDVQRPFLGEGSADVYELRLPTRHAPPLVPAKHREGRHREFLPTAHDIGRLLVRQAIWHGNRCTWLGAAPATNASAHGTARAIASATLSADVYSGVSGVAFFLANLFAATADDEMRRAAIGATVQALATADDVPPAQRLGLHTGWPGVAFAAATVASAAGERELARGAASLMQRAMKEPVSDCEFDLLEGKAGAIIASVRLSELLDNQSILEFATRLGDDLVRTADATERGSSWSSVAFPKRRNLTGLSHGTSGAVYALLTLFDRTGESRYRITAERALAYERSWFAPEAANWPDFREGGNGRRPGRRALSFGTTWCNGAPGIALVRLRAYEILADETNRTEALTALRTTRAHTRAWLHSGLANYSLCHGLSGNSEVLAEGERVLGPDDGTDLELVREVGVSGIDTYPKRGHRWPCGAGGGESPSLMLGLAGIGLFYLRLHAPDTPSILTLPRPSDGRRTASARPAAKSLRE